MGSGVAKITGAFIAGLVVAIGSALLYVHVHDRRTEPLGKIEQAPVALAQRQPSPPEEKPSEPAASAAPEPAKRNAPTHRKKSAPTQLQAANLQPANAIPDPEAVVNTPEPVERNLPEQTAEASPTATPQVPPPPATQAPPPPTPHRVELAAGTALAIRLSESLSTKEKSTGDTFRATLDQPIIRNGFIIADKGSKVVGKIVNATQSGRVKGVASMSLSVTEINTTDGQRVRVETNPFEKQAEASTRSDAAKVAGGAALGTLIGALGGGGRGAAIGAGAGGAAGTGVVLATRGKPAVIPSESLLTFQLAAPVTITEKLNQ